MTKTGFRELQEYMERRMDDLRKEIGMWYSLMGTLVESWMIMSEENGGGHTVEAT